MSYQYRGQTTSASKQASWPMNYWQNLLDLLLPHHCPMCLSPSSFYICEQCEAGFKRIDRCCAHCSLPLNTAERYCADCLDHKPSFDKCICAYEYAPPFDRVISMFKEGRDLHAAVEACIVLADRVKRQYQNIALPNQLIPVPMHWRQRWQRGFNQSEVICHHLSQELGIPISSAIQKTKVTGKQKSLTKRARRRNLIGSFSADVSEIEGKHIAIVDDVVTTASTANVLSELCRDAGATRVDVWALSRTPKI